jgi:hypothetical protein
MIGPRVGDVKVTTKVEVEVKASWRLCTNVVDTVEGED